MTGLFNWKSMKGSMRARRMLLASVPILHQFAILPFALRKICYYEAVINEFTSVLTISRLSFFQFLILFCSLSISLCLEIPLALRSFTRGTFALLFFLLFAVDLSSHRQWKNIQ
ncbi:hypothetical protein Nepgr_019957 [Nepenthes gracilis]|uniref:Uncharacterized protein n=1 Tax=Nepenthes gracilis TaxID=150966 RepID=A0AAD3SW95_NEPGR|nr:hypothetical protein Nepgr_019957 [Nepenthes gracilis]